MPRQFDSYDDAKRCYDSMARDRMRYAELNKEVIALQNRLNNKEVPPEKIDAVREEIEVYTRVMDKIESTFSEKYGLNNIKQLVNEIREVGKDLERLQRESQSQQEQDPFQQVARQDDAREEYLEKSAKTIEATQDYIDKVKKTVELIEQGKYYEAQEIEAQKAFETMQRANYELSQSRERLQEVMGGKLPTRQQGANILHGEIQEGFDTKEVDDIKRQQQALDSNSQFTSIYEQPEQTHKKQELGKSKKGDEISDYALKYKLREEQKEQQQGKNPGLIHEMS